MRHDNAVAELAATTSERHRCPVRDPAVVRRCADRDC